VVRASRPTRGPGCAAPNLTYTYPNPTRRAARRWRSFFTSGSSALYLFLYSAFYFYTKLDITKARPPPRAAAAPAPRVTPPRRQQAGCQLGSTQFRVGSMLALELPTHVSRTSTSPPL